MADVYSIRIDTSQLSKVQKELAKIKGQIAGVPDDLINAARELNDARSEAERLNRELEEAGLKLESAGEKFKKSMSAAADTIRRGVLEPLKKASGFVAAMGLSLLGILALAKGSIQAKTDAQSSGMGSILNQKRWEFVQENTLLGKAGALDTSNFNSSLNLQSANNEYFGILGLNKQSLIEMRNKKGMEATYMFAMQQAQKVLERDKANNRGQVTQPTMDALAALFNLNGANVNMLNKKNLDDVLQTSRESQNLYRGIGEDGLIKSEKTINMFLDGLDSIRMSFVSILGPAISDIVAQLQEWSNSFARWLASPDAREALKNFIEGMKNFALEVIPALKDAVISFVLMLDKLPGVGGFLDKNPALRNVLNSSLSKNPTREQFENMGVVGDLFYGGASTFDELSGAITKNLLTIGSQNASLKEDLEKEASQLGYPLLLDNADSVSAYGTKFVKALSDRAASGDAEAAKLYPYVRGQADIHIYQHNSDGTITKTIATIPLGGQ